MSTTKPILPGSIVAGGEPSFEGTRSLHLQDPLAQTVLHYLLDLAHQMGAELPPDLFSSHNTLRIQLLLDPTDLRYFIATQKSSITSAQPPLILLHQDTILLDEQDRGRCHLSLIQDGESVALSWSLDESHSKKRPPLGPSQLIPTTSLGPSPYVIPSSPLTQGAIRAIYAAQDPGGWGTDAIGRPTFEHERRDGTIIFSIEDADTTSPSELIASLIGSLNVETADIFLILLARIAELDSPADETFLISLDELAKERGVYSRSGSREALLEDLHQHVLSLTRIRLSMVWTDYEQKGHAKIRFGADQPDHLLHLVDILSQKPGTKKRGYSIRPGQALAHFLKRDGLRWLTPFSKVLLQLNPHKQSLAKRIGTYLSLIAPIAHYKGQTPSVSLRKVLEFCAERPQPGRHRRTVDRVISAYQTLQDIGLLAQIPDLEPTDKRSGYFDRWLDLPRVIVLHPHLQNVLSAAPSAQSGPRILFDEPADENEPTQLTLKLPETTAQSFVEKPQLITDLQRKLKLSSQSLLAQQLECSARSLRRYINGTRPVPAPLASVMADLWNGS